MTALRYRSFWLVMGWLCLAMFMLTALSPWGRIEIQISHHDKIAHSLSFLLLTSWFSALYTSVRSRVAVSLGLTLFGVIVEYLQLLSGQRVFSLGDMAANIIGIAIALWLIGGRLSTAMQYVERQLPIKTFGKWRH